MICDTFGVVTNNIAHQRKQKKNHDANEWIPTEAVKKVRELQQTYNG